MSMKDKVVLITGASRGIGRAIAENFVELGATVLGTATSEKGAAAISEYLGDAGKGLVLNVTETDSITALFDTIKTEFVYPAGKMEYAGKRGALPSCEPGAGAIICITDDSFGILWDINPDTTRFH